MRQWDKSGVIYVDTTDATLKWNVKCKCQKALENKKWKTMNVWLRNIYFQNNNSHTKTGLNAR